MITFRQSLFDPLPYNGRGHPREHRLMDAGKSPFGRPRYARYKRSYRRIFIIIQLLSQMSDMLQNEPRIDGFDPQLFIEGAVDIIPDVADPPRRSPVSDERIEEHTIEQLGGEIASD